MSIFWQITQHDSEMVIHLVTRLNKRLQNLLQLLFIMHLSSTSPRGGPRADVGTLLSSCIFPTRRFVVFFALQTFILWTVSKHSDFRWNLNVNYFFLNTTKDVRSLVKISTFLTVLNSPDSVLNISGLMKNKLKHTIIMVHCSASKHNVLKFPKYSEGCCDASEIKCIVNIKKNQLFLSLGRVRF